MRFDIRFRALVPQGGVIPNTKGMMPSGSPENLRIFVDFPHLYIIRQKQMPNNWKTIPESKGDISTDDLASQIYAIPSQFKQVIKITTP